jgi:hypothetical protein
MYGHTRAAVLTLTGLVATASLYGCSDDAVTPSVTSSPTIASPASQETASTVSSPEASGDRNARFSQILAHSDLAAAVQSRAWNDTTMQVSIKAGVSTTAQRLRLCADLVEAFRGDGEVTQVLIPVVSSSGTQPAPLVSWNSPDSSCKQDETN